MEITMELSCCKYPLASELAKEWENNRESLLAYMEQVPSFELRVVVCISMCVCYIDKADKSNFRFTLVCEVLSWRPEPVLHFLMQ